MSVGGSGRVFSFDSGLRGLVSSLDCCPSNANFSFSVRLWSWILLDVTSCAKAAVRISSCCSRKLACCGLFGKEATSVF
jgi:hypothetical protein